MFHDVPTSRRNGKLNAEKIFIHKLSEQNAGRLRAVHFGAFPMSVKAFFLTPPTEAEKARETNERRAFPNVYQSKVENLYHRKSVTEQFASESDVFRSRLSFL